MAKVAKTTFRCSECGWTTLKWTGRCGGCQAWDTVEEVSATPAGAVASARVNSPARSIVEVDVESAHAVPSGLDELDRVLGGGLVPGGVMLLAGEPGVGKSTLLLEVAALCADSSPVLYITGEESTGQVRLRADRLGALAPDLYLAAENSVAALVSHVEAIAPKLLIVDSVQTMIAPDVNGVPGGVTQVREVAGALIQLAKTRGIATVLVGHVTKDGSIAGPRMLEHLVDVVLQFDGDRHSRLRMLRAVKNRYGPTDEIGCFDLTESGLIGLPDPSGLFLTRRNEPVPGTCVTVAVEGRRPLIAEVQALVAPTAAPQPRRTTSGLDGARVAMVLAVLERRAHVRIGAADVYASTVGGVRLNEPSVDLAAALALASSHSDLALPRGMIAIGEVGLAGDVRAVSGVQRRLTEAQRLGFTHAIVPSNSEEPVSGIEAVGVDDLGQALQLAMPTRRS
ncbi:DNA repair protein RadA [Salinactinospora qingdaonensis]|uniref:DNA repair protein RadA n=1 Tax=Salinactinospora qingdaonensis TaxID=702744 RepID=A0ABP7GLP2_9ACTN